MHNPVFAQRLRVLGSAAFFSLVTAPALALFVAFVGLSFNASVSGYFLLAAHELVDGAPPGTVNTQVCEPPAALDGGEVQTLTEAYPPSATISRKMTGYGSATQTAAFVRCIC